MVDPWSACLGLHKENRLTMALEPALSNTPFCQQGTGSFLIHAPNIEPFMAFQLK